MEYLGIDIGGTGMKGAPVNIATGELLADRFRIPTPEGGEPDEMDDVVRQIAEHFKWTGAIGCTFPAIVHEGTVRSAANIAKSWIGVDAAGMFTKETGLATFVVNDADAAGVAEMAHGVGKGRRGVVLMLTLGTGIGSALFIDGILVPNTELGHLELHGHDAETRASVFAREREDLSWEHWVQKRLQPYISHVEFLFSPDLIILGGGVSKKPDKWFPMLSAGCDLRVAELKNNAGIVGAAMYASRSSKGE